MVSWFNKLAPNLIQTKKEKVSVPAGIWLKCKKCSETLYSKDFAKNYKVCPICNFHDRLTAHERIDYLFDKDSFVESESHLMARDIFQFVDTKKYKDRIKQAMSKTGQKEAVISGIGTIKGMQVSAAVFDFQFLGGSMGVIAGEKIVRAAEVSLQKKIPLLVIAASGGARMQESILSLMQMAKTSATLYQLKNHSIPYVSLLTDPTTGGVSASFAMLGDVNIAEPGALIGFAGPRVIKETIKQDLPAGFQRSEFLLEHGSIDRIVERKNLPTELHQLFQFMTINQTITTPAK